MNKGILHANGKYCLFLNSGDTLSRPEILEEIFKSDFSEDLVYFNTNLIYKNKIEKKIPPSEISAVFLYYRGMINHQSIFIKTELQKKYPYSLDFKIVSDRNFLLTALLNENCSTRYINITLSNYEAEEGLSSKNADLVSKECKILADKFFPKKIQEALILLEDYENGYKKILKRIRKVLFNIAKVSVRR